MDQTGYYWQGARYYDPVAGRFLSPDPLGHDASMDLYSYADGDPINECDPDGRFGKNATSSPVTWNANGSYNDPIAPYVAALKRQTAIDMGLDPEGAAEQQYYADMLRTAVSAVPVLGMFGSYIEATSGRALFTGQQISQGDALLGFGMAALGTVSMAKVGVSPSPLQSSLMPRSAARMELPTLSRGSGGGVPKPTQLEFDFVKKLEPRRWPTNDGFANKGRATLVPGSRIDRFGDETGKFAAPAGTPFWERGLPTSYATDRPYITYEVLRPIEVDAGQAAPAFGQPGGGIQFMFNKRIKQLIKDGFLREVSRVNP